MTANKTLLQRKYANVIQAYAMRENIPLRQALDIFYKSYTYQEMRQGISDMHCRSELYLAEEILREISDKASRKVEHACKNHSQKLSK